MNEPIEDETCSPCPPLVISRSTFAWGFTALVALMVIGYTWNTRAVMSPNDASRWDTVWSLVEYDTYEIFDTVNFGDKQQFGTIDKALRAHDGKTISTKPPLLPTAIAWFVRGCKVIVGEPVTKDQAIVGKPSIPGSINIYAKLTIWVFQVLPFLVCLVLYRRFLDRYATTPFAWTVSLITMGLGTLVTGYLVTLNNHVIAATAGFIAAYHVWRIVQEEKTEWWRFLLVGLATGWTAANELPAALFVIVVLAFCLWANWLRTIVGVLPPILLMAAAFLYTNQQAVGDPKDPWKVTNFIPVYLQKDLYQKDADGQPSYWARKDKSGIDALNDHPEPYWLYVVHSVVGHHGVFSLSPILLVATLGLFGVLAAGTTAGRLFAATFVFLLVAISGFYLFVTDQRNYGGFCHGLRWIQWLNLIWLFFLPMALDRAARSTWGRALCLGALAVSIVSTFDTWANPWTRSWLHRILLWSDVIDY